MSTNYISKFQKLKAASLKQESDQFLFDRQLEGAQFEITKNEKTGTYLPN